MSTFNYEDFYAQVAATPEFSRFVEVGVFTGLSVAFLAERLRQRGTPFQLYAVDLWERVNAETDYERIIGPEVRQEFFRRLKDGNLTDLVQAINGSSVNSATMFRDQSLDFVFIDANHSFHHVIADIEAWLPKIRAGGMIAGHDYGEPCGVKEAVDSTFGSSEITVMGTVWYKSIAK